MAMLRLCGRADGPFSDLPISLPAPCSQASSIREHRCHIVIGQQLMSGPSHLQDGDAIALATWSPVYFASSLTQLCFELCLGLVGVVVLCAFVICVGVCAGLYS